MPTTGRTLPRPFAPEPVARPPRLASERAAAACFTALVCLAPQLLGGAVPAMVPVIAAGSIVTLLAVVFTARDRDASVTPLVVAMLGALAWTAVQALPLPCALVRLLDAEGVTEFERALRLIGAQAPTFCSLSRDPGATRAEVVKGFAIVTAFLSGLLLAARGERRTAYRAVATSGVLMALVAMVHTAGRAETVFGLYRPVYVRDAPTVAPLLNPNALGGFLAMCVPLSIGMAFSERSRVRKTFAVIAAGVLAACTLMTRSRGAVIALALGLALLAVLGGLRRSSRARAQAPRGASLATTIGLAIALALALAAWRTTLWAEFRAGDWRKLDLIASAFDLGWRHPWLGVGRGAFASVFPAVHVTPYRFEHAENLVAQWSAEWGWPVAGALLVALAWAWARRLRTPRSFASLGALAAVATIATHNLVDLGLELAGVATVASALLGAATARATPQARRGRGSCARIGTAVAIAGALVLALLAPTLARDDSEALASDLRDSMRRGDREQFRADLAHAVRLHPMRPEFAVLAAAEAIAAGSVDAGRWVNRGMQLAPGWATPHVQAVQWLWRAGRLDQAIVELGAAAARDVHALGPFLCPLARYDASAVTRVAPSGPTGAEFLELASHCLAAESEAGKTIDAALARAYPERPWAHLRRIEGMLATNRAEDALREVRAFRRAGYRGDDAALFEARALLQLQRPAEAIVSLRDAARRSTSPRALLELEARSHAGLGADSAMRECLERLRGSAGGHATALRDAWMLEAELEAGLGNVARALHAYEEAFRITGDIDALARAASAAEQLGDIRRAYQSYSRLCDLAPERGGCARRDALRSAGAGAP